MKHAPLLLLTAAAAAALFGFVTAGRHLGLTEDCLRYLAMAKHAAAGKGLSLYNPSIAPVSLPYISQAPLWPIAIASGLAAGLSPQTWTWALVILLFGSNLFLAGLTALYGTGRLSAGLAAQFLILVDLHLLTHHAYALSEPLFFLLTQATVLAFWIYLDSGRGRWLAAAVIGAGLAGLTRYIGLTYAAGLALGILIFGLGGIGRRLPRAILFGILGGLPLGGWFIRHFLLTREWFGMHVAESQTHHFFPAQIAESFVSQTLRYPITNGWLPDRPGMIWLLPAVLAMGTIVLIQARKSDSKNRGALLLILFPTVYALGMIGVWTARSVQGYPDPWRLSAPIFLHLWIFLVICFYQTLGKNLSPNTPSKLRMILSRTTLVLITLWSITLIPKTYSWMSQSITTGNYGRPDPVTWDSANQISWFPPKKPSASL